MGSHRLRSIQIFVGILVSRVIDKILHVSKSFSREAIYLNLKFLLHEMSTQQRGGKVSVMGTRVSEENHPTVKESVRVARYIERAKEPATGDKIKYHHPFI